MRVIGCFIMMLAVAVAEVTPDRKVVYKKLGSVELKLHIFNPEGHQASDLRPAIVFFFGGGWKQGSPSQFYPQCRHLAGRGMVAISAEYRVQKQHGTSPRECVKDGNSALRWLRKNAKELGIHPKKIAAGGGSAGGHVAAATGMAVGIFEEGEDSRWNSRPDALVLFNPVYDNGPGGYGHGRVKAYWREISPRHHLDSQTPPTIVFLGTEDHLVPVETAKSYRDEMLKHGVRSELHLYNGEKHGFFNESKYTETLHEMTLFLRSLGFLEGEVVEKLDSE